MSGAFYQKGHAPNPSKIRRYLKKCYLLVTRINMNNSKPCKRCLETIKLYGIKTVYYSDNKKLVKEKVNKMETTHLTSAYKKPWSEWN